MGLSNLTERAGYKEAANTINVISEPAAQPLPTGAPYPQSDQAGVFVDGHDSVDQLPMRLVTRLVEFDLVECGPSSADSR